MRKIIACLSLALFFGCASMAQPQVATKRPTYLDAVLPMQVKVQDEGMSDMITKFLEAMGTKLEAGSYANVCTISAINPNGYFLTAAHCVADIGSEGRYIEEQPLKIVFANFASDVAVVQAEHVLPRAVLPVNLDDEVYVEMPITIVGHPFGYQDVFVTKGWIANPHAVAIDTRPFMLFNCTAAPGNSGSPVLNDKGEIISVLQIGWGRSFSPVSGGLAREYLRAIAQFLPTANVAPYTTTVPSDYLPTLLP